MALRRFLLRVCVSLIAVGATATVGLAQDAEPAEVPPSLSGAPDPEGFADSAGGRAGAIGLAALVLAAGGVGVTLALRRAAREDPEPSMRDDLTGLADRRRLDLDLPDALSHAAAAERTVGIVMIDVDHFDTYRGAHGDVAGDIALRLVADLLRANVRDGDVVYRYGEEEFCALLGDTTDQEAREIAERLRAAVEEAPFEGEERQPGGRVTISVGLALTEGGEPGAALERADGALHEAQHEGHNRVVVVLGPDGPGLLLS
ncbi:MAG: GGDEF domain-containing protein [Actinomycetota bacterium]